MASSFSDRELPGECLRLHIMGAGSVCDGQIELSKEQSPPDLTGVEGLNGLQLLEVLVVCPDDQ